ncbi:MAG: HNH endonuclease signature motif containing protein [Chloroflexota bacterium]|nr:HNH endonuclease signature motif containing protein [Chloroflexota bacterium]
MIYQDLLDAGLLASYAAALNSRAGGAHAPGRLTAEELRDRILESGGRCEWCGCSLVNAAFELDHILSLSRGGANRASNLVLSCPDCNRKKGQKHPARFAAEIHLRTGRKTALVMRVFERYGIEPARQNALFAAEAPELEKPNNPLSGQLEPTSYSWPE